MHHITKLMGPHDLVQQPRSAEDATFNEAYTKIIDKLYGNKPPARRDEASFGRIYNLLSAYRKEHGTQN